MSVTTKIGQFARWAYEKGVAGWTSGLNNAKGGWARSGLKGFMGAAKGRRMAALGRGALDTYRLGRTGLGRWDSAAAAASTYAGPTAQMAGSWLTAGNLRGRGAYRFASSAARIGATGAALDFLNPFSLGFND